jgi:hypothetical protein
MFLLWPIYFPWYLSFRAKMKNNQVGLKEENKIDKKSGAWIVIRPILIILGIIIVFSIIAIARGK